MDKLKTFADILLRETNFADKKFHSLYLKPFKTVAII